VPLFLFLLALAAGPAPVKTDSSYRDGIEKWRADRVRRLTSDDGWLTVVGLSWLEPGENAVGAAPSSRVPLPRGSAPPKLGTIRLGGDGKAVWTTAPGATVTHEGKPVGTLTLAPDTSAEPTILQHGTLSFYLIERGGRVGVRVKDTAAPARKAFHGIPSWPVDPKWRVTARFEPYRPKKSIPIPNVLGQVTQEPSSGAVVFSIGGREYRIDAVDEEGEEDLFLIFGDSTNGNETYGAGRFLYAKRPGADGKTVVDFNKAYNPPCAFTAFATCPLPPPQNRLPVAVTAGEKRYGDH
jgi:uncharacterized protein (DUF1684 family)